MSETPPPSPSAPKRFPAFLRIFEPAPPAPVMVANADEIKAHHRYWQRRVLVGTILGYAVFYMVRKNLSMAMPVIALPPEEGGLGITKTNLGLFLTLHGVIYGVAKLVNGLFGDRCHARTFMVAGLILSGIMNLCFGFSSAVMTMGICWMINGWFQGMGYPPCARLMTHWIPPRELATKMSIWNASTNIGAGLVVVTCGYLLQHYGNWRLCFLVPAGVAFLTAVALWFLLPDTPPSVGLPEVSGTHVKDEGKEPDDWKVVAWKYVFSNPWIWLLSIANFFVYIIRYALLDWGPTLLVQMKHFQKHEAGWIVASFEITGMVGALVGGWLTDRYFGGRGFRSCVFYMIAAGISILAYWKLSGTTFWGNAVLLCMCGFFIYGPQCLIGIAAANLATKKAAATAVGLTGVFAYASTILSGWGYGALVDKYGWNAGFIGMLIVAVLGTVVCAIGWKAKAHGYEEAPAPATCAPCIKS